MDRYDEKFARIRKKFAKSKENPRLYKEGIDKMDVGKSKFLREGEAGQLYHKLFKGSDMQKDDKGRPKRIDCLPQKIKDFWEQKKLKKKT